VLTPVGAEYFERVSSHFDGIRRASSLLHSTSGRSILKIRSYTTFASRWLIPRLSQFQLAHPELDIRLTTGSEWTDLGEFDAAVRLGDGNWPDLEATPLVRNELQPVCSPELLQSIGQSSRTRLSEQIILLVRARPDDWQLWCESAGLDFSAFSRRRELESSALAYLAATEGRGIALAQLVLIEDELRSGALVAAHEHVLDRKNVTYYLVADHRSQKREMLARLRRWLKVDGSASDTTVATRSAVAHL
jgi:LysR family glycine cleavage system transcriptional activator